MSFPDQPGIPIHVPERQPAEAPVEPRRIEPAPPPPPLPPLPDPEPAPGPEPARVPEEAPDREPEPVVLGL
jgi:hypothetical protein